MKLPILIFKGNPEGCYGIMQSFSEQLRDAFTALGEEVIYLDPTEDFVTGYINRDYKAVFAFMDTLFDNYMSGTDIPLFNLYRGPKFNYWPDHPSVFYYQTVKTPDDYYILTQDRNYAAFINRYYKRARAFCLPPGGTPVTEMIPFSERTFDVSFVGTYRNWKKVLEDIHFGDESGIRLRDEYLDILVNRSDLTTEEALKQAMARIGFDPGEEVYLKLLNQMHRLADGVVSSLFREKLISVILENGIYLDVFGNTWYDSPFAMDTHLRIHPESNSADISRIYSNSKISLNIMTWHKDSITERVLDAMCAGSVVLTDRTALLEEGFEEGKEVLFYSLTNLSAVPQLIRDHIDDEETGKRGRQKAMAGHLWVNRAEELLKIIEMIGNDRS